MLPRDVGWVSDVFVAITEMQTYVVEIDYDDFLEDTKTQHAVMRLITIVGEATKNLSEEFRTEHNPLFLGGNWLVCATSLCTTIAGQTSTSSGRLLQSNCPRCFRF